ncbi:hypothetical protein [Rothia nasimurium]|uniref:hypothetical protein n=1 Tax=Rothia nasimurium TaxID=85336 RepID=UPI0009F3E8AC|nr:hypothetical protein [Rothia nasimurium]
MGTARGAGQSSTLDQLHARLTLTVLGVWQRASSLPLAARVALIYAASRVWGWAIFSAVGLHQTYSPWKGAAMTYSEFVMIWDADWYATIADTGYPSQLPLTDTGQVAQNEWAFYPLYPLVAGALTRVTGLSYQVVAPTLSLLAGFGAAWFIFRLFESSLAARASNAAPATASAAQNTVSNIQTTALWGLAAVSFCAVAPILQTGYAEAFGLLFLSWALYLLVQGRYGLLLIPALAAALSRPVGVPLGATVGIWWAVTVVRRARAEGIGRALSTTIGQLAGALAVCAFAFIHPVHAWLATGRIDAYTATETAWRTGGEHVSPFLPWLTQSQNYLGQVVGPAVLVLLLAAYLLALTAPLTRAVLHPALLTWCAAYALYMLAFFNPQSSTFRLLLPLFPLLLPVVALSASQAYRWLLLGLGATTQFGWVGWLWHWKQLPGGGDYPP